MDDTPETPRTGRRDAYPIWDDGLQPERTSIAWTRTSTALIAVGLIGTRLHEGTLPILLSLAGLVFASVFMYAAYRRGRAAMAELQHDRLTPPFQLTLALTLLVIAVDVSAIVMMLVTREDWRVGPWWMGEPWIR